MEIIVIKFGRRNKQGQFTLNENMSSNVKSDLKGQIGNIQMEKRCQVVIVPPLLFQAAFNYALYPPVTGRSTRLYEFAPMRCRRFTISSGMSLSSDHPVDRGCVVSGPLPRLSPYRISRFILPCGGGKFLSWTCVLPSAALHLLTNA